MVPVYAADGFSIAKIMRVLKLFIDNGMKKYCFSIAKIMRVLKLVFHNGLFC